MCTKLEIYAKSGRENEYYLEDNLRCKATSSMTLNNAMLFWQYKNVRQNVNDTITHGRDTIIFNEGYWTFDMIQDKLRDNKIALKFNAHDNTCKIYSEAQLNLKKFWFAIRFFLVVHRVTKSVENKSKGCRH